jgi:hypothetical protein
MIYRLDDLIESRDFEHDQKFVKAEYWESCCEEIQKLKADRAVLLSTIKMFSKLSIEPDDEMVKFYARQALKAIGEQGGEK